MHGNVLLLTTAVQELQEQRLYIYYIREIYLPIEMNYILQVYFL